MSKKARTDKEKAQAQPPRTVEVGVSGIKRHGGYIYEDFLTSLQGKKGAQVYREMATNEAVIAASLWTFDTLLQRTPWHLEPADDTPEATRVKDFVEECLGDFDGGMGAVISRALTAMVYGYALCEKVYKIRRGPEYPEPFKSQYRDNRWGIAKLPLRKQTSIEEWVYADDNRDELLGAVQIADHDAKRRVLPLSRLLHFRFKRVTESPEGTSALRPCYPSYYAVKHLRFVEGVGIERNLAGIPYITVPPSVLDPNAGTEEAATLTSMKTLGRSVRMDEQSAIVFPAETDPVTGQPSGYKFELLGGAGNKPADVDPVIKRYESRMAMVLLMEVMLLGQDSMGSYALSKDKTELLVAGLESILGSILQVVQEQLLVELVELNGWDTSLTPTLGHGAVKAPNLADLAAFLGAIAGAGLVIPGDAAETWAREQIGMPVEDAATGAPAVDLPIDDERPEADLGDAAPQQAEVQDVQKQVLNGAQISSLMEVVQNVAARTLPRDAAVGIISVAFQLSEAEAERLLGSAGKEEPSAPTAPLPDLQGPAGGTD